ncbi:Uncharacterised protein [Serratia entomophila]|jgi:hypothetical protein|nr:Uncharacterised protein [Serratia entomophila]CAI2927478.1 Uncharacterised protein [Serratia entomophila]
MAPLSIMWVYAARVVGRVAARFRREYCRIASLLEVKMYAFFLIAGVLLLLSVVVPPALKLAEGNIQLSDLKAMSTCNSHLK